MNDLRATKQKLTTRQLIVYGLILTLLLGCGAYLLFAKLDVHSVTLHDEARHGINAYEMDQNQDYILSTYQGEADYFNLKPPLSMWGIIAGYRIFGYNLLGLRVYSPVSMFLCMLIFAWWMKKHHGWVSCLCALALLVGCDLLYTGHSMRYCDAEAQFFLFYTIAMLCMLSSARNIRTLYGSALCFGFAFLSKSWHAAMIPVTCLAYLCVTGEIKKLRPHHYLALIGLGLLPIAPWAILRYQRDGFAFFTQSITTDVQARMAFTDQTHWTFYLTEILRYSGMALGLGLCAVGLALHLWKKKKLSAQSWGLILWTGLPPFLYSFSGFRVYWYAFPMIGGMAIAGGLVFSHLLDCARKKWPVKALCLLLIMGIVVQIGIQFGRIETLTNTNTFQRSIAEVLDREYDSGIHAYIQYDEKKGSWQDSDMLRALLAGDVICLKGGQKAFMKDEESAILFVSKWVVSNDVLEYFPVILEEGDVWVLQN